jgi:hypothetical protein
MTTTSDVLTASLAHFGLPKSGTRDEKINRLILNQGDKRKRSPGKAASKLDVPDEEDDEEYETFFQENMQKLLEVGVSEDLAQEQVGRRWTAHIALRNKTATLQDQEEDEEGDVLELPLKLNDDQVKQNNYVLIGPNGGNYTYKKVPTPSKPSKIAKKSAAAASLATAMDVFKPLEKKETPPKEAKAKTPTPKKAAKAPAPPVEYEEESDDDTAIDVFKPLEKKETPPKEAKAKTPTPKKAAKAPAPPVEYEEESDDDTALKEHSAGQVERLLRRHSKKWMMEGLAEAKDTDYESLTKKQVAERFIELLNGDTDDEGEGEE